MVVLNGEKIPAGWQPFGIDSFDNQDPFYYAAVLQSLGMKIKSGRLLPLAKSFLPVGNPLAMTAMINLIRFLLRRSKSAKWDGKQLGNHPAGIRIPAGWGFAYDCKDQSDPVLLRRCTVCKWDKNQK